MNYMTGKARNRAVQYLKDNGVDNISENLADWAYEGVIEAIYDAHTEAIAEERERCAKVRVLMPDGLMKEPLIALEWLWDLAQDEMEAAIREEPLEKENQE